MAPKDGGGEPGGESPRKEVEREVNQDTVPLFKMCSEKAPDGKSEEGWLRKEESQGAPPGSPAGRVWRNRGLSTKPRVSKDRKEPLALATRRPLVTSEESLSTGGGPGSVKE